MSTTVETTNDDCTSCECKTFFEDEKLPKSWFQVGKYVAGDKDNWVLSAMEKQKWDIGRQYAKVWNPNDLKGHCWIYYEKVTKVDKKDKEKKEEVAIEKGLALHHIISKEKLDAICSEFDSKSHSTYFWDLCTLICDEELVAAAKKAPPVKLLWNLPINLEIGPEKRVHDPGSGFDGNTIEGDGRRYYDDISQCLERVEHAFDQGGSQRWCSMVKALYEAWKASGFLSGRLPNPSREQWVRDDHLQKLNEAPIPPTWQKKGLRYFMGEKDGLTLFAKARQPSEETIVVKLESDSEARKKIICKGSGTKTKKKTRFELSATAGAILHICRRHNYRYFDKGATKAVNNFWPEPMTFDQTSKAVEAMLPDIALRTIEDLENGGEDEVVWSKVELGAQKVGNGVAYFIVAVEYKYSEDDVDDQKEEGWIEANLETACPDDQDAHAYSASQIKKIFEELEKK